MKFSDLTDKLPTSEEAASTISALGATGVAVIAFWTHQLGPFAPPDHDSMEFFKAACTIAGLGLGVMLYAARKEKWFKARHLFIAAGVIVAIGLVIAFIYDGERHKRVEMVELADGPHPYVVSTIISGDGRAVIDANHLNECEGQAGLEVSWGCARRLASLVEAYEDSFSASERDASLRVLTFWYRISGALLMSGVYLLVNQFMFEQTRRTARIRRRADAVAKR